ncbi:hypothetical protein [Flavobacterium sp. LC2016-01]
MKNFIAQIHSYKLNNFNWRITDDKS